IGRVLAAIVGDKGARGRQGSESPLSNAVEALLRDADLAGLSPRQPQVVGQGQPGQTEEAHSQETAAAQAVAGAVGRSLYVQHGPTPSIMTADATVGSARLLLHRTEDADQIATHADGDGYGGAFAANAQTEFTSAWVVPLQIPALAFRDHPEVGV